MDVLYENIRKRREELGMSQTQLAEKAGYTDKTAISKIELGKQDLSQTRLAKIAEALCISPLVLMGYTDERIGEELSQNLVTIEHIASISAGYGRVADQDVQERVTIPRFLLKGYPPQECKMLTVKGNSMYPRFMDGDKVVFHLQRSVDSESIAVIQYGTDEITLKKVRYERGKNWLELIPLNPEYQPKRIEGADLETCHVCGLVISQMRLQ